MIRYGGDLPPDRLNLARYSLERARKSGPEKTALIVVDEISVSSWTYTRLERQILCIAHGLGTAGFVAGDRLLLRLNNGLDYVLVFFGAIAAGMVPIPVSPLLIESEIAFVLEDAKPRGLVGDRTLSNPKLPPNAEMIQIWDIDRLKTTVPRSYHDTSQDDPAFIVYTSGTSGRPKGVMHAQRAAWGRRPMYEGWYGITSQDTVLHSSALNWTYSLGTGLMDPWANGATSVLYCGPRSLEVWPRLIVDHGVSIFASVPALYRQLLKYCELGGLKRSLLRHCLSAGETLSSEIQEKWHERTEKFIYEAFGMSEISTFISTRPTQPAARGSCGRAQPGRYVRILPQESGTSAVPIGQTGLIGVHRSDPGLMIGYVTEGSIEGANLRGDWFISGDLGHADLDGNIWFDGRTDDMMNAMGIRLAPQEVEAAIERHPAVAEAAVVERKVRKDVSAIVGFVVLREQMPCERDSLLAFLRTHLAEYKLPKEIVFVESLPRTANGKLVRRALRNLSPTGQ